MSPVKDVHLMSDDEVTKLVGEAHDHVRQVHNIDRDHSEFDKFLQMHPYYADAVAEYKRRNLGRKSTVLNEPEFQQECSLTPEEIAEGKKTQNSVPEGSGENIPLTTEKLPSEEVPSHEQEAAIKKEEPNITDVQLKEEVATRKEEQQGAGEQ